MRRGWVVAGVLALIAVPSVPVAAAGVSLVLERVNGTEGVGKWMRTGDMQRFRVKLNGMGRGAKVAVATSPVAALAEVACMPSPPGQGLRRSAGPEASGGPVSGAVVGPSDASQALPSSEPEGVVAEPGAGSGVVAGPGVADGPAVMSGMGAGKAATMAVGALAMRALTVAGASALASTLPPGTQVCRLGKVAGERAVDVTLRAPAGTREVVVAAVARVRGAEDRRLTTLSRTAAVRVKQDATTFSGPARLLRPGESDDAAPPAAEIVTRTGTAHVAAEPRSSAAGRGAGAPGPGADGSAAAGSGPAADGSAAADSGAATGGRSGIGTGAGTGGRAADGGNAAVEPDTATDPIPSAAAIPSVATGPYAGSLPDAMVMPTAGMIPQAMPTGAGGESDLFASFQAAVPSGEPPLPWDMAVAAKPVRPAGWVSPIDGRGALPWVVGGIGVLMGALWLVVTVQRGRNRRKVL